MVQSPQARGATHSYGIAFYPALFWVQCFWSRCFDWQRFFSRKSSSVACCGALATGILVGGGHLAAGAVDMLA